MNHENPAPPRAAVALVDLPSPHLAGERAAVILDAIEAHPEFDRLRASTLKYPTCWATFTGYPLIAEWDLDADGPHLFVEALRTMAMKAGTLAARPWQGTRPTSSPGVPATEAAMQLNALGLTVDQRTVLIAASVENFCPRHCDALGAL
ncbi:hypothetical protein [Frankia gtarii]|uniref:hypothetical protein n=1 Tax=Frankia gtarii TaxID=2950102 RepID=UPI0021C02071|nr:hypothetical protein [Frankia gtarii]